ncbi:MAG: hypothetical protein ABIB04_01300 [Patescibacteria group bacterium]
MTKETAKKLSGPDSSRYGKTGLATSIKEVFPEKDGEDGSEKNIRQNLPLARIKVQNPLKRVFK